MHSFRRYVLMTAFKLMDAVFMFTSFVMAAIPDLKTHVSLEEFLAIRIKVGNAFLLAGLIFMWHIVFSAFGLYQSKRLASRQSEIIDVAKATTFGTLLVALAAVLFNIRMVTRPFLVVFWVLTTALAVLNRVVLRHILSRIRISGRNLRCLLIVGTNPRALEFARKIEAKPDLGYRLVGFVDEDWPGLTEFQRAGYPLVCNLGDLPSYLRNSVVDEVAVGLPVQSYYGQAASIVALCEAHGIIVRVFSRIFNPKRARPKADDIEDVSLIALDPITPEGWPLFLKRALDFLLSLTLLIVLAPLFVVIAVLVKLTSQGPVFFAQDRVGLNKRIFKTHKFRTMVADAEKKQPEIEHLNEASGPVFKVKDDPRFTPVGRFLRKTSLDELPQLFDVLEGDMSLVGPRPLPLRDYQRFDQDWQRRRLSVRPGITCLWQVNGRSAIPFEKWMELDMQYIDQWSLWLDLKILAKTIPAVLRGSGAA